MTPENKKRRILFVDDEQDILDSLYDTFMEDYHVVTTTSANEALKLFDEQDISLVISDQRMPEMQGSQFLAKINEKKPICKKILLTGYSDLDTAIDAINLGNVDKYFSKPWNSEELKEAVSSLLSTYSVDQLFNRMMKDGKDLKTTLADEKTKNQLFCKFMNAMQWPVCIVNSQIEIQLMNQTALKRLHYSTADNLLQQNMVDALLTDISKTDFESRLIHQQNTGSTAQLHFKTGDGGVVKSNVQLLFTHDDNGAYFCGFVMME